MIEKTNIEKIVNEFIKGTSIFLVAVKVSSANKITVLVDTKKGITIDECAAIHRHLEKSLDRDLEDFEMLVSSPGLDMPFAVLDQYIKNEGRKVEVTDNDGERFRGSLKNVTTGGFELETGVKELSFNFDQVKSTKVILTIK
jgi:ribosome maturation factor RimP